jgi:3-hydroxybutyryl-CoA dehydrogenase
VSVERIGVVGAGTMGLGIAQVACLGGFETRVHDPVVDALAAAPKRMRAALDKGAERGRWTEDVADAAIARLSTSERIEDLAGCEVVIEAAPEDLELKRALFARLSEVCGPDAVLATNTSSLPVTAMASAAERPERVVGMHFFNPPALMELVEIVAGEQSSAEALAIATEAGRRMGRTPVRAADSPGFLANRVARPFGLEALRMLGDRIADHETIDRIVRIGGGFRMGPFELMDLVGIDVGFEVSKSFYEQSFHEPRWQPHPIQARMVQADRHGRKAGRGYYDYTAGPHRPDDPAPPAPTVEVMPAIEDGVLDAPGFRGILLDRGSLAELDDEGGAVGFYMLPPLTEGPLVELTRGAATTDASATAAEDMFRSGGLHVEWVDDAPGLVLGRIVCQVINEAAFALQKGVGAAEDIDTAMRLGFNYPRGPLEWADAIGLDHVLSVLDALHDELGEERYRAAPLLRRMVAEGRLGRLTGEGFFAYG